MPNNMDQDSDATELEDWASIGAEALRKRGQIRSEKALHNTDEYSDGTDAEDWANIGPEALRKRGQKRVDASRVDNTNLPTTPTRSEQDLNNRQDEPRDRLSNSHSLPSFVSRIREDMSAPASSRDHPSPTSRTMAPTASISMNKPQSASQSPVALDADSDSDSDLSPVDESFLNEYEFESRAADLRSKRKYEGQASATRPAKLQKIRKQSTGTEMVNRNPSQNRVHASDDEDSDLSSVASEEEDQPVVKARKRARKQAPKPAPKPRAPQVEPNAPNSRGRNGVNLNEYYEANQSGYLKFTKKNHWSNPGTKNYDVKQMLESDQCLAPDNLLNRPTPDFKYIMNDGTLRPAPQYDWHNKNKDSDKKKYSGHPKYAEHVKKGTNNRENQLYYEFMPKDRTLPLAGLLNIKETKDSEVRDLELAFAYFKKYALTNSNSQEEAFNARPSIHLPLPDHIKALLVDDWENVTKNQQLVPLPAAHPVETILNDYLAFENPKRQPGTHQADLLIEVVQGLKEYFEKCLGRILLYRFERQQYLEIREGWNKAEGGLAGKTAITTYGAEHFCRLLASLPELLAQTNMDQQSCNRLCEEITRLTIWLGRNALTYFSSEYETPGPAYIEKARNG